LDGFALRLATAFADLIYIQNRILLVLLGSEGGWIACVETEFLARRTFIFSMVEGALPARAAGAVKARHLGVTGS
jgi:hypothetical protein